MKTPPKLSGPQEHIYTTDPHMWDKRLKAYARENRKAPTPAENRLWQHLRGNKMGAKFRRQHAIDFFIVDFICVAAKLTIELDGEIHRTPEQAEYDQGRTFMLTELGYRELRFTNHQVLYCLPEVIASIKEQLSNITGHQESPDSPLFWRGRG